MRGKCIPEKNAPWKTCKTKFLKPSGTKHDEQLRKRILAFAKRNLDWRDWIEVDKEFQKPYEKLFSDSSLMKSLGWEPKTAIGELLNLMY